MNIWKFPDNILKALIVSINGEIYPNIRAIAVQLDEDNNLLLRSYLDREPTEGDLDSLYYISDNVSDYTTDTEVASFKRECVYSMEPLNELNPLDCLLYERREYNLEEVE